MATEPRLLYGFGPFQVDPANHQLLRDSQPIAITPKAFETLLILLRHSPEMVSKDEMMKELWPDTFVEEANLSQNIFLLRKALGDSPEGSRYIVTIPKLGYRFAAGVRAIGKTSREVVIASHTRSEIELEQVESGPDPSPSLPRTTPHRTKISKYAAAIAGSLVVTFALLLAFNVAGLRHRLMSFSAPRTGMGSPEIGSIAVLPLANVSGDPKEDYFADGMTDELIATLGGISSLRITSRTSVQQFKKTTRPLPEIARELHVDAILEGSVMHAGGRVRITAELVSAGDRELWSDNFESDERNVLLLQDEMAREIADDVRVQLLPAEREQLAQAGTIDPEAHDDYLKALLYYYRETPGDLPKAIENLRQALQLYPNYAEAYASLAACYYDSSQSRKGNVPNDVAAQEAKAAALKALSLNDRLAEPHVVLGAVAEGQEWDWAAAGSEFKRAMALEPNLVTARVGYAWHLAYTGNPDAALEESDRAAEMDPASSYTLAHEALIRYFTRHYDPAIEHARKGAEMFADDPSFYGVLADAYQAKGRYAEAVAAWQQELKVQGEKRATIAALGRAFHAGGIRAGWRWWLDRLRAKERAGEPGHAYSLAAFYSLMGEKEEAFHRLDKMYATRGQGLPLANLDSRFDNLRSDPRFRALMARLNLPQ